MARAAKLLQPVHVDAETIRALGAADETPIREAVMLPLQVQEGESQAQAIDRAVLSLLERILKQEASVVPLGPVGYSLREKYDAEIFERAVPQVVARVQAARPATQMPGMPGMPMPQPQPQPQPESGQAAPPQQ